MCFTESLHLEGLENDLMNWLSRSLSVSTGGRKPKYWRAALVRLIAGIKLLSQPKHEF